MPSERWQEFCYLASAHGYPLMTSMKSCGARTFWIIWYLICTLLCVYSIYASVAHYLEYPMSSRTEQIEEAKTKFPAVTVCNLNPFKFTAVKNIAKMNQILSNFDQSSGSNKAATTKAKNDLMFTAATLDTSDKDKITYTQRDFIRDCSFAGEDCAAGDISAEFNPSFGNCFKFSTKTEVSRAGPMQGLELELDVKLSEYLPVSPVPGIMLTVHDPNTKSFPEVDGHMIPAGGMSSVGIEKTQYDRLAVPFGGACSSSKENLSLEGCLQNCNQKQIIDKCECASPRFPLPKDAKYCDFANQDQVKCLKDYEKNAKCDCRKPCQESIYSLVISTVPMRQNEQCLNGSIECKNAMQSKTSLQIYLRSLSTTRYIQEPTQTLHKLFSDIGFVLMLYLGINLVNIWELLVFAFQMCCCKNDK